MRALVTGASSGIGAAVALALAKDGYQLLICGRDPGRLRAIAASLAGGGHESIEADLTIADQRDALVERAGVLNAVIHAAGKHSFSIPTRVDSRLREVFAINVEAPIVLTAQLLAKDLIGPGAVIVFISSAAAIRGSRMTSLYAASKAALVGYARALAADLAPQGIRVLTVLPGIVETPMGQRILSSAGSASEELRKRHLLGLGQPKDVASVIAFVCSPGAQWMTGTEIVVDGGFSIG